MTVNKQERVFVPVKYLGNYLKTRVIFIPRLGDGITVTQKEFREYLSSNQINSSVVRNLEFKLV